MPAVEKSLGPRSPDWVESWESSTLLMTARWGCVSLALSVLDRMAAGCSTAYFGLLALSWTGGYHICCDTALWPSHFMSPLNFHTLNSCMKRCDAFSIPFSFFCLSPLLLSFGFGFGFLFSKQRGFLCCLPSSQEPTNEKFSKPVLQIPTHLYTFLYLHALFLRGVAFNALSREEKSLRTSWSSPGWLF